MAASTAAKRTRARRTGAGGVNRARLAGPGAKAAPFSSRSSKVDESAAERVTPLGRDVPSAAIHAADPHPDALTSTGRVHDDDPAATAPHDPSALAAHVRPHVSKVSAHSH